MDTEPVLLGEKLAPRAAAPQRAGFGARVRTLLLRALNICLLTAVSTLPVWWIAMQPDIDAAIIFYLAGLIGLWLIVFVLNVVNKTRRRATPAHPHWLLAHDRQGFMQALRLDARTVLFDGSNIYHFGLKHELGTRALTLIAQQLRTEGYRVVCFFDANIFYTLSDQGVFAPDQSHSLQILERQFGLRTDEIYVVPSGVQADRFILDTLLHLPKSFALTNDQFRDYAKQYPTVMTGDQWRKGVMVSGNEIKVLKHRLKTPIRLS